jgi:hypothetical protein
MNRLCLTCVVLVGLLCSQALAQPARAEDALRVGVAEIDITPPNGFPIAGYFHERLATGTRDPLQARALVLRGPNDQAALVACDLCGVSADLSAEVRRRASARTGIPAAHIVVAATHSHTSPDYARDLYQYLGVGAKRPKTASHGELCLAQPYASHRGAGLAEVDLPA